MGIAYSLVTARIASFAVEPPAGAIGMAKFNHLEEIDHDLE